MRFNIKPVALLALVDVSNQIKGRSACLYVGSSNERLEVMDQADIDATS
jgi:hypothetical protein